MLAVILVAKFTSIETLEFLIFRLSSLWSESLAMKFSKSQYLNGIFLYNALVLILTKKAHQMVNNPVVAKISRPYIKMWILDKWNTVDMIAHILFI